MRNVDKARRWYIREIMSWKVRETGQSRPWEGESGNFVRQGE